MNLFNNENKVEYLDFLSAVLRSNELLILV